MSDRFSRAELEQLLQAGATAPSGGNSQPWRVVAAPTRIEIYVDPQRSGGVLDHGCSASCLALGSFAECACIEAAHMGRQLAVEVNATADLSKPQVVLTSNGAASNSDDVLRSVIFDRATNRKPHDGTTVDREEIDALAAAVQGAAGECQLHSVREPSSIEALALILAQADVVRTFNREYHQQMLSEMRFTNEEVRSTQDGIDLETLELSPGDRKGLSLMRKPWFVSLFVTKRRVRTMTMDVLRRQPVMCCISLPRPVALAGFVRAGTAVMRAWLRACSLGLCIQPWCVLPFLALRAESDPQALPASEARHVLELERAAMTQWNLEDPKRPIFIFRVFRAEPPSRRALRRPVDDFTEFREG